jgi:acetyl esterase/lipase
MPPNVSFADMGGADGIRKMMADRIQESLKAGIFQPSDFTGVQKSETQIPSRDGASLRAVIYRPESGEKGPLFVYYHGGGFVCGFPEVYESAFEVLTKELGFTVVGVAYRLAPEAVFPTAANDAFDSLKWASPISNSMLSGLIDN